LLSAGLEAPFLWFHLFNQGSLTEMIQWFLLAGCIICCGLLYGRMKRRGYRRKAAFFLLLSLGISLMLLEDAGDIRFQLAHYATFAFGGTDVNGTAAAMTEFAVYALIAVMMVYPVVRFWRDLEARGRTLAYLGIGYSAYAISAVMSASAQIGEWYTRAGEALIGILPIRNPDAWTETSLSLQEQGLELTGYYLMDLFVEESLELVGAAFLLAFLLFTIRATSGGQSSAVDSTPGKKT
jgi:hypothetical protein